MADLGSLTVRIDADTAALTSGIKRAQGQLQMMSAKVQAAGRGMQSLGKSMSIAVTAPLLLIGKMGLDELKDIQAANAQTEASLQRIGRGALVSVAGVQALASALQQKSGIDDQAIQTGANFLLTLGSIDVKTRAGAAMLAQATTSMTEFADSMGMDAGAAGKLYAKTMAAASEGTLLLPRGVKLGDAAMKKLKGAFEKASSAGERQKLVLDALSAKFKGGMRLTDAERWELMKEKIAGISATMLTKAIPTFQKIVDFVSKLADRFNKLSPAMQGMIGKGTLIAGVLGPVIFIVGSLVTAIGAIGLPVVAAVAGLAAFAAASVALYRRSERVRQIVAQVIAFVKKYKIAIAAVLLPVAALIVGLVKLYQRSAAFRNIVQGVISVVKFAIGALVKYWTTIARVVATVVTAIAKSQTFKAVLSLVATNAGLAWSALTKVVSVLISVAGKVAAAASPITEKLKPALTWISGNAGPAFNGIKTAVSAVDSLIAGLISRVESLMKKLGELASRVSNLPDIPNPFDRKKGSGGGGVAGRQLTKAERLTQQLSFRQTRDDLAIAIQKWKEAIGKSGAADMVKLLQRQYDALFAYLSKNGSAMTAQDRTGVYNRLTDILTQIKELQQPAESTSTSDTTTTTSATVDAGVFRSKRPGASAASSGPVVHIASLTIQASSASGGRAAAAAFKKELEDGKTSRAMVGTKRRVG